MNFTVTISTLAVIVTTAALLSSALPRSADPPASNGGGTLSVAPGGGGTHTSLAAAVADAVDGDTIELSPGTYTEAVVIDRDIAIIGSGPADEIIISVDEGPVMSIEGAEATVSGLTFTGPTSDGLQVRGGSAILQELVFQHVGEPFTSPPCGRPCISLKIDESAHVIVLDNEFVDGGEILVDGGSIVQIEGNALSGGPHIALFELGAGSVVRNNTIAGTKSRGIGLYDPTDIVVSGNTITDTPEYGITVGWGTSPGVNPVIVANTVSGAANGIDVARSAEPQLQRNVLFDNGVGIVVRGSDAAINANDLSGNGQGIVVSDGAPELGQNAISGGAVGIAISSAATPVLTDNSVCGNGTNVLLTGDAEMPDLGDNDICEDAPAE